MCNCNFFLNLSLLPLRFIRFFSNTNNDLVENNSFTFSNETPKKIISWNIQELFIYTNTSKVDNIIDYIKTFDVDVICLQEVFEDKTRNAIIEQCKCVYPYHLKSKTNKKFILGENSGLLVLSKLPIKFEKEVLLERLCLPDSLANKSILYFSIGKVNFSTTHLQSIYENVSESQIYDIIVNSPFDKFILTGDLNNTYVPDILKINKNNIANTCENRVIDYILPINYKDFEVTTKVLNIDLNNTSDHYPISATLNELFT